MAFNDLELKRIQKAAEAFLAWRRPPVHIRDQLDYEYSINKQTVELLEVRPVWNRPEEILKRPFARTTYVRSQGEWRVYWMRGNLKWHPYDPPDASSIQEFFELVKEDYFGCFFG